MGHMDLSIGANTVNYMRRHLCLRSLFILALLTANTAIAWECAYGPSVERTSIETLYEKATNVLFIQITKGELVRDEIQYSAKVIKNLKGKAKSSKKGTEGFNFDQATAMI